MSVPALIFCQPHTPVAMFVLSFVRAFLIACVYLFLTTLHAHTSGYVSFTCPIDGTKFDAIQDMSGTSFGARLDFKKIGPIAQPWALAQCPECKFVMFDEEFDDETIAMLKPFILSDEYKGLGEQHSSYYYFAQIRKFRKDAEVDIAWTFVQASWQVEEKAELYDAYIKEALVHVPKALEALKKDAENVEDYHWLCYMQVELNRRIGNFDTALNVIQEATELKPYAHDWMGPALDYQATLISQKDKNAHEFSEVPNLPE